MPAASGGDRSGSKQGWALSGPAKGQPLDSNLEEWVSRGLRPLAGLGRAQPCFPGVNVKGNQHELRGRQRVEGARPRRAGAVMYPARRWDQGAGMRWGWGRKEAEQAGTQEPAPAAVEPLFPSRQAPSGPAPRLPEPAPPEAPAPAGPPTDPARYDLAARLVPVEAMPDAPVPPPGNEPDTLPALPVLPAGLVLPDGLVTLEKVVLSEGPIPPEVLVPVLSASLPHPDDPVALQDVIPLDDVVPPGSSSLPGNMVATEGSLPLEGATQPDAPVPAEGLARPQDGDGGEDPATAEALVAALYPLVLHRPADEHGLRLYADMLRARGPEGGLLPVLRSLLASEEHGAAMAADLVDRRLARDVAPTLGAPAFGPVRHVVSLGTSCYPAWLMQRCGLKRWSGPFDWLFSSTDMVVRCLEDDFRAFLDPAQLRSLGDGRSTHAAYGPGIEVGPVFNHRDVTLPEHRAYTERCVVRLRAVLAGGDATCFLMVLPGHASWPDRRLVAEFGRVCTALAGRTAAFQLLMVSHDDAGGGLASSLREVERRAEGSLFRFRSASAMQAGLSFGQEWDNLALKRLLWSNSYELGNAPGRGGDLCGGRMVASSLKRACSGRR